MIKVCLPRRPSLNGGPRKVYIARCSSPSYWYKNLVGQTILCEFIDREGYWAREGGIFNCINVIKREDAKLLDLEN